ncbi:ABC transporter permease [Novosphingobium colocasiae]
MDAVFLGKLFAMLAVSFVGIATWAAAGGLLTLGAGSTMPALTAPAVGWPMMLVLSVVYFSMAYLLLGSVFLTIGSMAPTVRDVQTLSMPATMMQLLVFLFATDAMAQPGTTLELAAAVFPFSSPFVMLARAATDGALMPHVVAIIGQALVVLVLVRFGSRLFRRRVMQSGPAGGRAQAARAVQPAISEDRVETRTWHRIATSDGAPSSLGLARARRCRCWQGAARHLPRRVTIRSSSAMPNGASG